MDTDQEGSFTPDGAAEFSMKDKGIDNARKIDQNEPGEHATDEQLKEMNRLVKEYHELAMEQRENELKLVNEEIARIESFSRLEQIVFKKNINVSLQV